MPKFLYRLENKESLIGFYNHLCKVKDTGVRWYFWTLVRDRLNLSFSGDYHLSPYLNGLGKHHNNSSRYGFCSLNKLRKWFGTSKRFYDFCAEYDMVIRRYTVENRYDSDRQSIAMIEEMNHFVDIPFHRVIESE
jgi:hypothetical protein